MSKVHVILAEGFEEIEAIAPIDILRRADIEVVTVSITGQHMVTGAHHITLKADILFENADFSQTDLLFLPGGMPGSKNLNSHTPLKELILDLHKQNKYLSAICAAPIVFGGLNLLKDKKATCYPGFEKELIDAKFSGNKIEQDKNIITGKGAGVAPLFGIKLVETLKGNKLANTIKNSMFIE